MKERCIPRRTLRLISRGRDIKGFTITELLNGAREVYLKRTTDYTINPQTRMFAVIGTKGHGVLEEHTGLDELTEERLYYDMKIECYCNNDKNCKLCEGTGYIKISGQLDYYDPEEATLLDTKTAGSYKVAKAKGIKMVDVPTGGVYKSGAKKGQPKTRKESKTGFQRDVFDWAVQLNFLQNMLEKVLPKGYEIKHRKIEAIVRDGGTMIAQSRGIFKNAYLIPIGRISEYWLNKWLKIKVDALKKAFATGEVPKKCSRRESWNGRKCQGYCDVAETCEKLEGGCKSEKERVNQEPSRCAS